MTALFVVLFLGQWERQEARRSAVTGLGCALLALVIFGSSQFIIGDAPDYLEPAVEKEILYA